MTKRIQPPPKEELEQLYLVERRTSPELAKRYGCSYTVVLRWLRMYGIEVRSAGFQPIQSPTVAQIMSRDRQRPVCATIRKHAEDLKDDPERLSTEFLQKLIGVKC